MKNDLKSSELLAAWLSDKQIPQEVSDHPMPGFDFYIILGGPIARVTGQFALKYIPERVPPVQSQGLLDLSRYDGGGSTFVFIAGSTRKENS